MTTVVSDRAWKSNWTFDSCLKKRERTRERERERETRDMELTNVLKETQRISLLVAVNTHYQQLTHFRCIYLRKGKLCVLVYSPKYSIPV